MKRVFMWLRWWIGYRIRKIKTKITESIPYVEWFDDMDFLI